MKNKLPFVLLFICLAIVYSNVFKLSYHGGGDLTYFYKENLLNLLEPLTWLDSPGSIGLGGNNLATLWIYLTFLPFGLLYKVIGLTFNVSFSLVFTSIFLLLGLFSMYKLSEVFSVSMKGRLLSTALYLINSYILLVVDGGQVGVAFGYALVPLFLFFKIRTLLEKKFYLSILSALAFSLLIAFDIRIAFLALISIAIFVLFYLKESLSNKKFIILSTLIFIALPFLIHSFWIVPFLKFPNSISGLLPRSGELGNLSFIRLNDALLIHQPLWPSNFFGKTSPAPFIFSFIPMVVFLNLFFRNDKKILFLNILAIISIFLAKGINPPFGFVNQFIFERIPGFFLFRDPSKFMLLEILSFSILFGYSADKIVEVITQPILKKMVFFLGVFLIAITVWPAFTHSLNGLLGNTKVDQNLEVLQNTIGKDESFGRTIYAPNKPPLGFSSDHHPAVDPLTLSSFTSIKMINRGNYDLFNFIRSPLAPDLLSSFGIQKVVIGKNFDSSGSEVGRQQYFENTVSFLSSQDFLLKEASNSSFIVYTTKKYEDKFSVKEKLLLINSSQQIYSYLKSLDANFLSNNLVVFLSDVSLRDLQSFAGRKNVYLINPENENIKYDLLAKSYMLGEDKISTKWGRTNAITGDWESILHQNGIQYNLDSESDDPVFYSTRQNELLRINTNQQNILLFKVYKNRRGGEILVGSKTINTLNSCDCFQWDSVETRGNDTVVINKTGINAIRSISQIPPDMLQNNQLNQLLSGLNILTLEPGNYLGESIKRDISFKPDVIAGSNQTESVIKNIDSQDKALIWRSYKAEAINVVPGQVIDYSIRSNNDADYILRVEYLDKGRVRYEDELTSNKGYIFTPEGVDTARMKIVWGGKTPDVSIGLSDEKTNKGSYLPDPKLQSLLSASSSSQISWKEIDSTRYNISTQNAKGKFLVFSEKYDPNWVISREGNSIEAYGGLNSFYISSDGDKIVLFAPQKMVDELFPISVVSILMGLLLASYLYVKKI